MNQRIVKHFITYLFVSLSLVYSSLLMAAESSPKIQLERIFPQHTFTIPLALIPSHDNTRFYVLEKEGKLYWIDRKSSKKHLYIDLSEQVNSDTEGGLLGMAIHPDYPRDGRIFLSMTVKGKKEKMDSVIVSYVENTEKTALVAESAVEILRLAQPFLNHNGGQITFGPDNLLYIGFGDGGSGNDPKANGQNLNTLLGAMLRIDINGKAPYSIPKDNPFIKGEGRPEIYAYGLRNPWRWSFDKKTHALWVADVGQNAFEEINILEKGGNYGWPCFESFSKTENPCPKTLPNALEPIAEYPRKLGQSITGGYVYRGPNTHLQGLYFFADFISGKLWTLKKEGNTYKSKLELENDMNISSFGEDHEGHIYVTEYKSGGIFQIKTVD